MFQSGNHSTIVHAINDSSVQPRMQVCTSVLEKRAAQHPVGRLPMEDARQALLMARRAIAIADSKEYDEDVVRRLLENADEELKAAGLRRDESGCLSEAA